MDMGSADLSVQGPYKLHGGVGGLAPEGFKACDQDMHGLLPLSDLYNRKRSPTHQAPSRCCPKTTTAIRTYNIPQNCTICKNIRCTIKMLSVAPYFFSGVYPKFDCRY